MKILRSGPFPRKSSGACLFLVGLLGLSSTTLLKRKKKVDQSSFSVFFLKKELINIINGRSNKRLAVPFFHKTRASLIFPAVPVVLCVQDMLSKGKKHIQCRWWTENNKLDTVCVSQMNLIICIPKKQPTSTMVANLSPSGGISFSSCKRLIQVNEMQIKRMSKWY